MYLAADAVRLLPKAGASLPDEEAKTLKSYQEALNAGTRFIPDWVKLSVAVALGLGTMVGWRRIVVTVGERIGKQHLAYAQGASAEIVAAGTIGLAEVYGLPVSTTTSCRVASPAPWRRTAPACNGAPCATWRWLGF